MVVSQYKDRLKRYTDLRNSLKAKSDKLSALRLGLFVLLILSLVAIFEKPASGYFYAVPAAPKAILILSVLSLIFVIRYHLSIKHRVVITENLIKINECGPRKIERQWSDLEAMPTGLTIGNERLSDDLGVFGEGSLGQLLLGQSTLLGDQQVVDWLEACPEIDTIVARQKAIAELQADIGFMQGLSAIAMATEGDQPTLKALKSWSKEDVWLPGSLSLTALVSSASMVLILILLYLQYLSPLWMAPFIAMNLLCVLLTLKASKKTFNGLERICAGVYPIEALSKKISATGFNDSYLADQKSVLGGQHEAYAALQSLKSIIHHSRLRYNPIPYLFMQLLFAWDVQFLRKLKAWKSEYSASLPGWLEAIANIEAIKAFATLNHDNPDWCTPEVTIGDAIEILDAGNPLIDPIQCVSNNIILKKPYRILVVTGSNMSGKTTFMRTLGLNVQLAMAGANVCAAKMSLPRLLVMSSMHVKDSLKDGLSYFMNELLQIKQIVETAEKSQSPKVLFLLDEVLKGTNGPEREVAVLGVIRQLVGFGAVGAMTTHDISVAGSPQLDDFASRVYFQEEISDSNGSPLADMIQFDYMAKPGLVKNTNALRLLKIVGIDPESSKYGNQGNRDQASNPK